MFLRKVAQVARDNYIRSANDGSGDDVGVVAKDCKGRYQPLVSSNLRVGNGFVHQSSTSCEPVSRNVRLAPSNTLDSLVQNVSTPPRAIQPPLSEPYQDIA